MKRVLFVSDLHARPDEPRRTEIFIRFLRIEATACERLYLLGDLFEFGFVFGGRILPDYEPLVEGITALVRNGVEVFFLAGNHDLWMTEYLRQRGLRILNEKDVVEIFDRKVQFFHGILREPDALSLLAARVTTNPTAVWLYSLLPYPAGFNLALRMAQVSRKRNPAFPKRFQVNQLKTTDRDAEVIISGHHHYPCHFRHKTHDYYCIGDWISYFTYIEMTKAGLKLKAFPPDTLLDE